MGSTTLEFGKFLTPMLRLVSYTCNTARLTFWCREIIIFAFDALPYFAIFCHFNILPLRRSSFDILPLQYFIFRYLVFSIFCLFDILPLRCFATSIFCPFDILSVGILRIRCFAIRCFAIRYSALSIFCDSGILRLRYLFLLRLSISSFHILRSHRPLYI